MSIMQRILTILMSAILATTCAGNAAIDEQSTAQAGGASGSGGGSVVASSVQVRTSTNGLLGYMMQADHNEITMLTTTGWIVEINYDGTVRSSPIYYSGASCTGTAAVDSSTPLYGRSLIYDGAGTYYKPTPSPAIGTTSSFSYNSRRVAGACLSGIFTTTAVTLTTSTGPTEAGLPATITGPILLETP